jgi:hypothetical protein
VARDYWRESDPVLNRHFSRQWTEPQRRRGRQETALTLEFPERLQDKPAPDRAPRRKRRQKQPSFRVVKIARRFLDPRQPQP